MVLSNYAASFTQIWEEVLEKGQNEKEKLTKKVVAETSNINSSELQYLPGKVLDCVVPSRHPVTQVAFQNKVF